MDQKQIQALMDKAPQIRANSLSGDYRTLAEFNGVVLAGHQSPYGMEFVTWEWVQDHTSLWQGHYYGQNFDAAQRDFITRSGLLAPGRMFTDQQLAVIYDAAQNMIELDLVTDPKQGKLLDQTMDQIEEALPQVIDLANELTQAPSRQQQIEEMGGMTQMY